MSIRVRLVDDQALVRAGFRMILDAEADIEVVGEAESLRAGASGFLVKDVPAHQLVAGIRVVAVGDAPLALRVTKRLIGDFAAARAAQDIQDHPPAGLDELTTREMEVFKLI